MNLQDRMNRLVQEKKIEQAPVTSLIKEVALEEYSLNLLNNIDEKTYSYLQEQTFKIKETTVKTHTELGKIFYETQEKLSSHNGGCFEEWYTLIGFKKRSVYNYINRFTFLEKNKDKKSLIESLPLQLVYTISSPNYSKEMIDLVLEGEIKNLQELSEISQETIEKPKEKEIEIIDSITAVEFYDLKKKVENVEFAELESEKKKKIFELYKKINDILQ